MKNREANRSKVDRYNSHLTALTPTRKKAQLVQRKKAKRRTNYERRSPAKNKRKMVARIEAALLSVEEAKDCVHPFSELRARNSVEARLRLAVK